VEETACISVYKITNCPNTMNIQTMPDLWHLEGFGSIKKHVVRSLIVGFKLFFDTPFKQTMVATSGASSAVGKIAKKRKQSEFGTQNTVPYCQNYTPTLFRRFCPLELLLYRDYKCVVESSPFFISFSFISVCSSSIASTGIAFPEKSE